MGVGRAAESKASPSQTAPSGTSATVESTYPGLASGALTLATLGALPGGTWIQSRQVTVTERDYQDIASRAPAELRDEVKKNAFFFAERIAAEKLLLAEASQAAQPNQDPKMKETERIQNHLKSVAGSLSVSDAEIADFYAKNKDMVAGASLETVKETLRSYLLEEKQQKAVSEHLRTFGRRVPIVVSTSWAKEQAALAKDNPVSQARASGRPSIVDFGADGCRPCDMMAPILATLKKKYAGKANVEFVHVRKEQILAARYGIQSIPVQVFFDKNGKEVFRHSGFFPQNEIEKKLAEMGVQ
jgi:thioredoxin 1